MNRRLLLRIVGPGGLAAMAGFLFPGVISAVSGHDTGTHASPALPIDAASVGSSRSLGLSAQRKVYDAPAALDPGFANGKVVSKTSSGVILNAEGRVSALRLGPDTIVWKEFDVTPQAIDIGDWIDAKGTPLDDGSLAAQSGWVFVNIGKRTGVVQQVTADTVTVDTGKGVQTLLLSTRLEVIEAGDQSPIAGGVLALEPGTEIGAVGLRLPDGRFRATRIWR